MNDWSDEETDEPLIADHRNFYGQRVERMLFAGISLDRARLQLRFVRGSERAS